MPSSSQVGKGVDWMPPANAPNFREWKEDVLETAADRFERRLAEEIGTLRVEMTRGFAELRTEFRVDLSSTKADLIKWSFVFWIGQIVAMIGILAFMLRGVVPR